MTSSFVAIIMLPCDTVVSHLPSQISARDCLQRPHHVVGLGSTNKRQTVVREEAYTEEYFLSFCREVRM